MPDVRESKRSARGPEGTNTVHGAMMELVVPSMVVLVARAAISSVKPFNSEKMCSTSQKMFKPSPTRELG